MNPLAQAVQSVECPVCKAGVGVPCDLDSPLVKVQGWHTERFRARPLAKVAGALKMGTVNKGSAPCGKCRVGSHHECAGRRQGKFGLPGQICTCNCAAGKGRREAKRAMPALRT